MPRYLTKYYVKCRKGGKYCDICGKPIKIGQLYYTERHTKFWDAHFHKKCESF